MGASYLLRLEKTDLNEAQKDHGFRLIRYTMNIMNPALTVIHFPNNAPKFPAGPNNVPHRRDGSRGGGLTAVVADVSQGSTRLKQHLLVLAVEQLNQWGDEACLHTGTPHEFCNETNTLQINHHLY